MPACCEATRPPLWCLAVSSFACFFACWVGFALPTWVLASTFAVTSAIPVPHITLSLLGSSYIFFLSSTHSLMRWHYTCSCAACASSIVAMQQSVWCSSVPSHTCCLTVRYICLVQSSSMLTSSEVSFLSRFPFLSFSLCSLAAMKNTHIHYPDLWPAATLSTPGSPMSISLSTVGFLIITPMGQLPSCFAIVPGMVDVTSSGSYSATWYGPWGMEQLLWGQFDAAHWMPVSVYHYLWSLLRCFTHSACWSLQSLCTNQLNWVDFHLHLLFLTHPLSSECLGMLAVSFPGQFNVRNWSSQSGFQLLSLLLIDFAVFVSQDSHRVLGVLLCICRCKCMRYSGTRRAN